MRMASAIISRSMASRARLHIEEIRRRKFSIGAGAEPNPLTEDLHHAVRNLSLELYTKDVHFLMELIQNAEDNEYPDGVEPSLEFVITSEDLTKTRAPATLLVMNNEIGFSKRNMESICSVGKSTKRGRRSEGFVGEKGIGFKSVFLISKHPYIFSNGYRVKFSDEPTEDSGIGYIVPEWVECPTFDDIKSVYGSRKNLPTTIIILPLRSEKVKDVKGKLSEVHPELLLFLSKIKNITVSETVVDSKCEDILTSISVSSRMKPSSMKGGDATSFFVRLSAEEKTEMTCHYYMWRQAFLVNPENKVDGRKEVDKCTISLAFPLGTRITRGAPLAGIFAFLPTEMLTNFHFIIQADFMLASSRETILMDNKWNLGILERVPSMFVDAFVSYINSPDQPLPNAVSMLSLLPTTPSHFPVLNTTIRDPIRKRLQKMPILPCEPFSDKNIFFCKPFEAISILPDFRKILMQAKEEGLCLEGVLAQGSCVLHFSVDDEKHDEILDFLGVGTDNVHWYGKCIEGCDLVMQVSGDTYIDLLLFIKDYMKIPRYKTAKPFNFPLQKYLRRLGKDVAANTETVKFVYYAETRQLHAWLNKWNNTINRDKRFDSQSGIVFMSKLLCASIARHVRRTEILVWLCSERMVVKTNFNHYMTEVLKIKLNSEQIVSLAHFLYHSCEKKFVHESYSFHLPIIDGHGKVHTDWTKTLVPASGSNWEKLFGFNPFREHHYVDIGQVYAERREIAGEHAPEKSVLSFLVQYTKATDIPKVRPPDVAFPLANTHLTSEKAFLLLDWIQNFYVDLPTKFSESIRNGEWMKTSTGFKSPNQCFFSDEKPHPGLFKMTGTHANFPIIDEEYYGTRISQYNNALKFLRVKFLSEDSYAAISDQFILLASSKMTKDDVYSLLKYIKHSKEHGKLSEGFLTTLSQREWLKTSQGYKSPRSSVFVSSNMDAISQITNLPVLDEVFYGHEIGEHISELKLLGVVVETEDIIYHYYISVNFAFPADLAEMRRDAVLLLLRSIRSVGSSARGFIEKIKAAPWLRTKIGFLCPSESILCDDTQWGAFSGVTEVPVIDRDFYGSEFQFFKTELKAIGVAVDIDDAQKVMAARFESVLSTVGPSCEDVLSLLKCVRSIKERTPFMLDKLKSQLLSLSFLKTRHGYKSPSDSILFEPKWGMISQFVDLPLIDDGFYGIGIYRYRNELGLMGAIVDFSEGSSFVAGGLRLPAEPGDVTAETALMFLQCIRNLLKKSPDHSSTQPFLDGLKESKWLKTVMGYKAPKDCLLFDPAWEIVLKPTDAPFLDVGFYGTSISLYRKQLKAIEVKVDTEDICAIIYQSLSLHKSLLVITRMYAFLKKFQWKPPVEDMSNYDVWIPHGQATIGTWVKSRFCVLHDKNNLFCYGHHDFYVLDKHYPEPLLQFFSYAFGVPESPSLNDYVALWSRWESKDQHELTHDECSSFWEYIVANWDPNVRALKDKFSKLPAITSGGNIFLMAKNEIVIPDNPELRAIFSIATEEPLFVWYPREVVPSIPSLKLNYIYDCLEVKRLSELVKFDTSSISLLDKKENSDMKGVLIVEGLVRTVLGFLCSRVRIPLQERHERVKFLLSIVVYETDRPVTVTYKLQFPSGKERLKVQMSRIVFWEKNSHKLFVHNASYKECKTSIEFVTYFAREIACVLCQDNTYLIADLCRLIQMSFAFGFREDAVEFLLKTENLQISVEDEELVSSEFRPGKLPRTSKHIPSSSQSSGKKRKSKFIKMTDT